MLVGTLLKKGFTSLTADNLCRQLDKEQINVGPDLDTNVDALMVFRKGISLKGQF